MQGSQSNSGPQTEQRQGSAHKPLAPGNLKNQPSTNAKKAAQRSVSTNGKSSGRSDVRLPILNAVGGQGGKRVVTDTRLDYFDTVTKNCYTYYVGSGNNDQLIRRVMKGRSSWVQTKENSSMFVNFKWQQTQRGYKYDRLVENGSYKEAVNHFENNNCLTNKEELFRNLQSYCSRNKLDIWEYVPPTFVLNANDDCSGTLVNLFVDFYFDHWGETSKRTDDQNRKLLSEMKRRLRQYFSTVNDKRVFTKPQMDQIFVNRRTNSSYLWILKPTFLNRGRGIQVFSDLATLENIISENIEGYVEKSLAKDAESPQKALANTLKTTENQPPITQKVLVSKPRQGERHHSSMKPTAHHNTSLALNKRQSQMVSHNQPPAQKQDPNYYIRNIPQVPCVIKTSAFVVQKYLQNPYLIDGRKFDIRVWVLLTHDLTCYFFKQGYIRLSSESYKPDATNVTNQFMHLTNNAVQKYSAGYNTFCQGNQLSFDWFRKHLKSKDPGLNFDQSFALMKQHVKLTMQAAQNKIDPFNRKYSFEIFGYDFILDKKLKPWLIEVNNNPCIEQSSPLLASLIPRMLDDAFKLTIDQLFVSIQQEPTPKQSSFKVQGFSNTESMWQFLYKFPEQKKKKKTTTYIL